MEAGVEFAYVEACKYGPVLAVNRRAMPWRRPSFSTERQVSAAEPH